ncbi:MAG: hypothetical protein QXG05_07375 [Nitrososphaerota archaeon]
MKPSLLVNFAFAVSAFASLLFLVLAIMQKDVVTYLVISVIILVTVRAVDKYTIQAEWWN